jgi:hypothetical protein
VDDREENDAAHFDDIANADLEEKTKQILMREAKNCKKLVKQRENRKKKATNCK